LKEQISYRKEAEDQQRKLDKFIADKAEDWDIKNAVCTLLNVLVQSEYLLTYCGPQTRMMEESNKMIKDSNERLGKAVADLRDLVVSSLYSSTMVARSCLS
jgi:tubulin-specific chaperone A